MKVICIRFASGEEIIGCVVEQRVMLTSAASPFEGPGPWTPTGSITIERVRGITAQQIGRDEMGIAFFPWSLGNTDGQFTINLDTNAVAIYPAEKEIEAGYIEQTSPIKTARTGPGLKM